MFRKQNNGSAKTQKNDAAVTTGESENLYREIYSYDVFQINEEKLENLIQHGQGFYAALAVQMKLRLIDKEAFFLALRDISYLAKKVEEKNKYIALAEKRDPLVGAYLSVRYEFDVARFVKSSPVDGFDKIEESIENFKLAIAKYPESNKLLKMNFCKELNEQIQDMEKWNPANRRLQEQIKIYKKIKSPLDYFEIDFSELKQRCSHQVNEKSKRLTR